MKHLVDSNPGSVVQLTDQYRMHQDICALSNDIAYGGKLQCANERVATRQIHLRNFPGCISASPHASWLTRLLAPSNVAVFLDTDSIGKRHPEEIKSTLERSTGSSRREKGAIVNDAEAALVSLIVESATTSGLEPACIGVMSPFRAQLRLLKEHQGISLRMDEGLELSTIDRYQGRDKELIVLSLVRSNQKNKVGRLLEDMRRLNVAVTRAKCKLVIVGSFSTMENGCAPLRSALRRLKGSDKVIAVPPTALDHIIS